MCVDLPGHVYFESDLVELDIGGDRAGVVVLAVACLGGRGQVHCRGWWVVFALGVGVSVGGLGVLMCFGDGGDEVGH